MAEKPIGLKEALQHFDGYDSNHRSAARLSRTFKSHKRL